MWSVPESWATPSASSLLGRLMARRARHPDEFDCAVRVLDGVLPGESRRWRYRRSAVDPLVPDWNEVTLVHGRVTLRLRFTGEARERSSQVLAGVRMHHRVWPATEVASGAAVEIAADAGEAVRLGLDY